MDGVARPLQAEEVASTLSHDVKMMIMVLCVIVANVIYLHNGPI